MERIYHGIRCLLMAIVATNIASSQVHGQPDLDRNTIDGGGVMRSTDDVFELSGTIGQPDAGRMAGGDFELTGGFWLELHMGDCNEDGVVNLADHSRFVDCISGPIGVTLSSECACFDFNKDADVDLLDFATFQTTVNGN